MAFDTFVGLPLDQNITGAAWDNGGISWSAAANTVFLVGDGANGVKVSTSPAPSNSIIASYTSVTGKLGAAVFFKVATGRDGTSHAIRIAFNSPGSATTAFKATGILVSLGGYSVLELGSLGSGNPATANIAQALTVNQEYCLEAYKTSNPSGKEYKANVYLANAGVRGALQSTLTYSLTTALPETDMLVQLASTNQPQLAISRVESVDNEAVVADTIAPTLSSPTGAALSATTASASVTTNESSGTIWCLTNTSATATIAEIKSGGTSKAVTATGVQTFPTRTGLIASTVYYNHFVQDDAAAAPNTSAVANSASFTTPAVNNAPTFPGTIANITGTSGTAIAPVNVSSQFSDADTLTYSASPLGTSWPSGLVVNSTTGIISGTVATPTTTTGLKVRATDTAAQMVDSNAFNVTIAAVTGAFTTDAWTSSGTLRANQAFTGTWYSGGAIGTAGGTATLVSGTLSAGGVANLTGLPAGAGFLLGKATMDGGVFYQAGTVA